MIRKIVLCVLLCATAALPVLAQYESDDRNKVGLRLGLFRPNSGDLQDFGKVWMGPVVDWYLVHDHLDRPVRFVSASMFSAEKELARGETTKLLLAPLTYNWVKRFSDLENHWYAGGGAGICYLKFKRESFARELSDSSLKIGINLIGGYQINEHFFAEMQYDWIPKWQGVTWAGLSLHLGMRTTF